MKKGEKNKGGRPTIFNAKVVDKICERISRGESMRSVCRDPKMPHQHTVLNWLLDPEKDAFFKKYSKATEMRAEILFEETLEIADDPKGDYEQKEVGQGKKKRTITVVNWENIQRSRLRVDTRKWYISKVLPKKYGEKLDVTSGGKRIKDPRPAVITYMVPDKPKE